MKELADIRVEIDAIDDQLADLVRRRLDIVGEVAAAKREKGVPVSDPARERAILTRVAEKVGPEYENAARLVFTTLFGVTKARQRAMIGGESPVVKSIREAAARAVPFPTRAVVACPGVEGSYAQQAASALFPIPTILFFTGFDESHEHFVYGVQFVFVFDGVEEFFTVFFDSFQNDVAIVGICGIHIINVCKCRLFAK